MAGNPVEPMVAEAIRNLDLPPFPPRSHVGCRHQRKGASYVLLFNLAALTALHLGTVEIWNDPEMTRRRAALDPSPAGSEQSGYFVLRGSTEVVLVPDGRVLSPASEESLWVRYMRGESTEDLLAWLVGAVTA